MSDCTNDLPRRDFLRQVVGGSAALATTTMTQAAPTTATSAVATPPTGPQRGYLCFSQEEAAFIETLVDTMCPADELTASGTECGLAVYIDRQLAGDFGHGAKRYAAGPWQQGKPQHGFQLPMTPEQQVKAGIEIANAACVARHGRPFDQVTPVQANAFLHDLADGKVANESFSMAMWFNDLVYPLFAEACFADPIYGGNVDKVFWKMIGYPGLPATHTINMIKYRGVPFPGAADPKSIVDFS